MKALGIDIGTTTISSVVTDGITGNVEAACTVDNDSFLQPSMSGERIQNPEVIIEKVEALLENVLKRHENIEVIGLTGQMHGIVYVDQNGRHISPLLTWQDQRGNEVCFDNKSVCEIVKEKCGVQVYTGYGLVTHIYNVMKGWVPEGAVSVCTIMDYLGMVLTGRKRPLVHASNAAGLGFFDTKNGRFQEEALEALKISSGILPEVTTDVCVLGNYKGIPVCAALGDNQASFLGTVEDWQDTVLINVGTGSQVSIYSEEYFEVNGIETRPFPGSGYLLVGSSLCGGRAYALLEQFFRQYAEALHVKRCNHYDVMAQMLRSYDRKKDKLKVNTRFAGTRENPDIRGSIENICTDNFTPEAVIYGVLEGVAEELHSMYRLMEKAVRKEKTQIVASGNGIRKNVFLQEITAQKFDMNLKLARYQEEAACGAAKAGMMVKGMLTSGKELS